MAITTYAELQGAVTDWLVRPDLTSAQLENFVDMFEAHANRRLRVRQMVTTATITPASGVAELPADYLAWRRVSWTGDPERQLDYAHSTFLYALYPNATSDIPRFFTIEGGTIVLRPVDDTDIQFEYVQKIPALSDSNTSNWLLAAHPDAYLYGTLVEACAFVKDDAGLIWKAQRDEVLTEIEYLSEKSRAPAPLQIMGVVV